MDADTRSAAYPSPTRLIPGQSSAEPLDQVMREARSPEPNDLRIRVMDSDDLPFVTAQHLKYFPDGFFARLGPRFLAAYTRTYLTGPGARAYLAEIAGEPVGYLIGRTDPAALRRHVLRDHGRELLFRALGSLCLRPRLMLHFLRTRLVRYCRRLIPNRAPREAPVAGHAGVTAVLDYIVVTENARSRGLGAQLIAWFVKDATDAGCARVTLVTATEGGAGPYYDRLGWRRLGETRTPEGRGLLMYCVPLKEDPTP